MLDDPFALLRVKREQYDAYQQYLESLRDYWLARIELAAAVGAALPSTATIDSARATAPALDGEDEQAEPMQHHHHHESSRRAGVAAMPNRRTWFEWLAAGSAGLLGARAMPQEPATRAYRRCSPPRGDGPYTPVRTLNGWTLPYKLKNGVKEFHLVAEEVEHEFAPGCRAKCWGYNGSTPGPTIEAVEGRSRAASCVTNRLREHTSMHWHGLILPQRHGRRRRPDPAARSSRAKPMPTSSRSASTARTCITRTPTRWCRWRSA